MTILDYSLSQVMQIALADHLCGGKTNLGTVHNDRNFFFRKKKGWILLIQYFYIQTPNRVLLKEREITHKCTGKAGALCRLRPSLLHSGSPPSPAMKKL